MLVVKVELHSAFTGQVTEIGRMNIANVGGTEKRGDYSVQVLKRGVTEAGWVHDLASSKITRLGEVTNYPRLSYNVWRLVCRALRSAFPEEG